MSKVEYTGRCHCGEIKFSFKINEIREGSRCNCSLCIGRGAIMSANYIPAADFRPSQNLTSLVGYRWNDRVVDALFCRTCGIFPYFGNLEFGFRVNLGCVEQLDPLSLRINTIDGKSSPLASDPGPNPNECSAN
jgi:hypothetical protein